MRTNVIPFKGFSDEQLIKIFNFFDVKPRTYGHYHNVLGYTSIFRGETNDDHIIIASSYSHPDPVVLYAPGDLIKLSNAIDRHLQTIAVDKQGGYQ